MNEFLKYYGEHHISPVSQDISDLSLHLERRKRLYELLGIHFLAFRGAEILEVGAGSGYNTLVFLKLGAKVDIVEPNASGREQMQRLFAEHNIPDSQYTIHPMMIEEYQSSKQYDFVIAEGFLPCLEPYESKGVIAQLWRYARVNAGIVVTTTCEFSYFFEDLRRILGLTLVRETEDFEEKLTILSTAFASHLKTLKFANRPVRDWAADTILNPANGVSSFLNLAACVKSFAQAAGGGGGWNLCTPKDRRIYRIHKPNTARRMSA